MTNDKVQAKIRKLKAVIDHSSTTDGMRAAACHLLDRLTQKMQASGVTVTANSYLDPCWYGEKYNRTRGLTTTQIAMLIRTEIRLARKIGRQAGEPGALKTIDPIGDAPAEIAITVRTDCYSGGSSIDVIVRNIPNEWGWTTTQRHGYPAKEPTPALKALAQELHKVRSAYNRDGSNPSIELYDRRFGGHVMDENGRIL